MRNISHEILHGFKMIALVAEHMDAFHNSPALEFLEAGADVRACHTERVADLLGVERLG